ALQHVAVLATIYHLWLQIPPSYLFLPSLPPYSFPLTSDLHSKVLKAPPSAAMTSPEQAITVQYRGKVAIITLNQPKKLNALNQDLYYRLTVCMHEVAARDDVYITVLTGNGRFFSA